MSGFEKFKEELPSKEKFYSSLTDKKICDNENENVLEVWNTFQVKPMKDYYDLYLKCQALLLVDVFENSGKSNLKKYGLFLSHYLSAPALSWDAMFNMKKIELELISDAGMYLFFEKAMRSRVSYICKR